MLLYIEYLLKKMKILYENKEKVWKFRKTFDIITTRLINKVSKLCTVEYSAVMNLFFRRYLFQ